MILLGLVVHDKRNKTSLKWRHNGRNSVENHQPRHGLLNGLFRRRSNETSKLCVTGLCAGKSPAWGIHRRPVNYPHKCPVTRKMFPFDDVIMCLIKHTESKIVLYILMVSNFKRPCKRIRIPAGDLGIISKCSQLDWKLQFIYTCETFVKILLTFLAHTTVIFFSGL